MARTMRAVWLLAVLSLWLALVFFWWRSGREMDECSAVDERNTLHAAVSFKGALHLIRAQNNAAPRALGWDTLAVPARATSRELHLGCTVRWQRLGFARLTQGPPTRGWPGGAAVAVPAPAGGNGRRTLVFRPAPVLPPPAMSAVAPWMLTVPYDAWVVPYWAPVAIASVPLAHALLRFARRRHRRRRGRCTHCGYDLRESAGRCPECGAGVPERGSRVARGGTQPAPGHPG